jgi:hypothetical protein
MAAKGKEGFYRVYGFVDGGPRTTVPACVKSWTSTEPG